MHFALLAFLDFSETESKLKQFKFGFEVFVSLDAESRTMPRKDR